MRLLCLVVSLVIVGLTTAGALDSTPSQELQDIANYLNSQLSSDDIIELIEILPEALANEEQDSEIMQRSAGSIIGNVIDRIPWSTIADSVKNMAKKNPKFTKVLNLINDSKFRELVKNSVNSHTLGEFAKDVASHGFSWTEFLHLLLHALCSAANTLQHDRYTVSVCQVLQGL